MNKYSSLLYAEPSFLEGVGRLMDFAGVLNRYNYSPTPEEADRIALASDWYAIGDDMRQAIRDYAVRNGIEIRHDLIPRPDR
jgi:hypothetical protein